MYSGGTINSTPEQYSDFQTVMLLYGKPILREAWRSGQTRVPSLRPRGKRGETKQTTRAWRVRACAWQHAHVTVDESVREVLHGGRELRADGRPFRRVRQARKVPTGCACTRCARWVVGDRTRASMRRKNINGRIRLVPALVGGGAHGTRLVPTPALEATASTHATRCSTPLSIGLSDGYCSMQCLGRGWRSHECDQ